MDQHRQADVDEIDPAAATLAPAARVVFGDRLDVAQEYARLLMTDGLLRGLLGPREAPRIWERHLLNCGVVSELIFPGSTVADIGSGAGLPGIVLAIARPDLTVTVVEPLARRVSFLDEAVDRLALGNVEVVRARADDGERRVGRFDVVTARAVAPLDRLARWCLPLVDPRGRLLAMKGSSAAAEILEHSAMIAALGGGPPVLRGCGHGIIDPPTVVVEIRRQA